MDGKKWWTSKTLWVNLLAVAAIILQAETGKEILDPKAQAAILGVINLILRLVTNQPLKSGKNGDVGKLMVILVIFASLVACAGPQYKAETMEEKLVASYATLDFYVTGIADLAKAGAISKDEAMGYLDIAEKAKAALDTATGLLIRNERLQAGLNYENALRFLHELNKYLLEQSTRK